jgi:hypothetical protein
MSKDVTIQSSGGKARAANLSAEQRKEIARYAAEKRWGNQESLLPKETHPGILKIGDREIACSVLDNGLRVFSLRGLHVAVGSKRRGREVPQGDNVALLPFFLASAWVKPFIPNDLMVSLISPIQYKPKAGRTALGYEATLLPRICEVIMDAAKAKKLSPKQKNLADMAETLIRAFAKVGVIALVDEATGYQYDRARDELSKILEAYISEELIPWTKMFPDEFFKQIYRIQGWEYKPGSAKRTPYVGKLINKYVYDPLPPGVLDHLRKLNPVTESGYRKHKHFQFLTADTGNPHLDRQITAVTTVMKVSDDKYQFERNFEKAFPARQSQQLLPLVLDVEAIAQ